MEIQTFAVRRRAGSAAFWRRKPVGPLRIVIDARERTARVQPGVTPVELEHAAFYSGLAPLVDRSGFVLADLLAARVVTPEGDLVEADAELLRDIRTGRATGIVVDATYRLHAAAELRR